MSAQRSSARPTGERIEFYRSHGEWRWRYFAANGQETDASTEAYERRLYALGQAMQRHPDVSVFEASVATEPDGEPKHWIEL